MQKVRSKWLTRSSSPLQSNEESLEEAEGDQLSTFLKVPFTGRRRSRSFDASPRKLKEHIRSIPSSHHGTPPNLSIDELQTPLLGALKKSFSRNNSSSDKGSLPCVHCMFVEEYDRRQVEPGIGHPSVEFSLDSEVSFKTSSSSDSGGSQGKLERNFERNFTDKQTNRWKEWRRIRLGRSFGSKIETGSGDNCNVIKPLVMASMLKNSANTCSRTPSSDVEGGFLTAPRMPVTRARSMGGVKDSEDMTLRPPRVSVTRTRSIGGCNQDEIKNSGGKPLHGRPKLGLSLKKWESACGISVTISPNSPMRSLSPYQGVSPMASPSTQCKPGTSIISPRRTPTPGTPRLERQKALSGWLDQPSFEYLAPDFSDRRQISLESQMSVNSLDVPESVSRQMSFESNFGSVSIDVQPPTECRFRSFDSQSSIESACSSLAPSSVASSFTGKLLYVREALSASPSLSTSPPKVANWRQQSKLVSSSSEIDYMEQSPPSDIYLTVPVLPVCAQKRGRAASVDASFVNLQYSVPRGRCVTNKFSFRRVCYSFINPSPKKIQSKYRSRSLEICRSNQDPNDVYLKEIIDSTRQTTRKSATGEVIIQSDTGERRVLRSTPDWSADAINGDHLWSPTSASGDLCYVTDPECTKSGPRMKCSACRIVCHVSCIPHLMDKTNFCCKPTFRDVDVRQYRENTTTPHHWVHRRSDSGRCKTCGKAFHSKLSFTSKEIVAISCSWCKDSYHNKEACFSIQRIEENCLFGNQSCAIVPPSWIVKLPTKDSFKSSLRKSPKKRGSKRKDKEPKTFIVKPIPTMGVKPLLVFLNPKSGGNQGAKLLQKFQWLLNPRQVFDLTQGGPKAGLDLFKKVPGLRVLACGGDGTVGWVLSILDKIGFSQPPPVGVLPLGTGNDLARALGWGGGYTDEPISKILEATAEADTVLLDRWKLIVETNTEYQPTEEGKDTLPLDVVNNYFSFGVDAHIALEFHEAREARPEKFNSRLRNKMFYGQAGGKDLLQRKWKDLSEVVTLECDGKDVTNRLREAKVHAVLFLNIPSYGGGTKPWNKAMGCEATDDGIIEVVGLTTYQLPLLQAGGHGTCIAQCRSAKIVTRKTIPMQVDGEACRLNPSIITLEVLNKAPLLAKRRGNQPRNPAPTMEPITVAVKKVVMDQYEANQHDKDLLLSVATPVTTITVKPDVVLEAVRKLIDEENGREVATNGNSHQTEWCFIDTCTAERCFRVDVAQEHLHYIGDITSDDIVILEDKQEYRRDSEDLDSVDNILSSDSIDSNVSTVPLDVPIPLLEKPSDGVLRAAKSGDLKKLRELYECGYSLLTIDASGQTALHLAAKHGHKDVVKYLLVTGAPSLLDMTDNERGQTALHQAALHKRRSVCCMLVAAGASLSAKDRDGQTPRQLAEKINDSDLALYLESQEYFQQNGNEDPETVV
ncbi:diacylglycerol kinase zeta-like isoform X3 [Artemia franciscana]|uniref:diacylglycerol kinase zeta-like isoform X3 n=1 Tax=Artemia franciscana TaxID=6661 RepID=UPI0032DBD7B0